MLAALAQADLEPRLRREPAERPEAARHHDTFLETDAAAHAPEHAAVGRAVHLHLVDALDAASRVHQALGQGAVVGEEKQAAALQVQATDRIQPLVHVREQITHRGTALGVGQRAHHATRLVDHDGTAARAWRELLAVDGDGVADAIGTDAQLADHLAVHADASSEDERFGLAARGRAECAQDLLQAFAQPVPSSSLAAGAAPSSPLALASSARAASRSAPSPTSASGGSAWRSGRPNTSRKSFVVA